MPKMEFQQNIEVPVNTTTLFESEILPAAKLRPTGLKRLPNGPTTFARTVPLVPGMIRLPDGDITISGRVSIVQPADPLLGTFVGDHQPHFRLEFKVLLLSGEDQRREVRSGCRRF
jgi:hypothetical protein